MAIYVFTSRSCLSYLRALEANAHGGFMLTTDRDAAKPTKVPQRPPRSSRARSRAEKVVCRYCGSDDLAPSFKKRRDSRAAPASRSAMARPRETRGPRALGRRRAQSSFGRRSESNRGPGSPKGSGHDRGSVAPSRLDRTNVQTGIKVSELFDTKRPLLGAQSKGRSIRRVRTSTVSSTG